MLHSSCGHDDPSRARFCLGAIPACQRRQAERVLEFPRPDALVSGICTRVLALAIAMACVGSVGATPLEQGGGVPLGIGSAEHVSYASTDLRHDATPALDQGATTVVTGAPLAGTGASGALVINATFDSSITNDANSAAIEAMINN